MNDWKLNGADSGFDHGLNLAWVGNRAWLSFVGNGFALDQAVRAMLAAKATALRSQLVSTPEGKRAAALETQLAGLRAQDAKLAGSIGDKEASMEGLLALPSPGMEKTLADLDGAISGM